MLDFGGLLSELLGIVLDFFVGLATDGLVGFLRSIFGLGGGGDPILIEE